MLKSAYCDTDFNMHADMETVQWREHRKKHRHKTATCCWATGQLLILAELKSQEKSMLMSSRKSYKSNQRQLKKSPRLESAFHHCDRNVDNMTTLAWLNTDHFRPQRMECWLLPDFIADLNGNCCSSFAFPAISLGFTIFGETFVQSFISHSALNVCASFMQWPI